MSKIGDKIHVGSSNDCYIAIEEYDGCKGCAFAAENHTFTGVCRDVYQSHDYCCGIIWIKQQPVETQATTYNQTKGEPEMNADKTAKTAEEPKYILAEFLEAYDAYIADEDTTLATRDEFLTKYLLRYSSPEYHEYLRLKAIFG